MGKWETERAVRGTGKGNGSGELTIPYPIPIPAVSVSHFPIPFPEVLGALEYQRPEEVVIFRAQEGE
jgi:hypothetical protein